MSQPTQQKMTDSEEEQARGDGRILDPGYSHNEKMLNEYVMLHPMLTNELTRRETLTLLSRMVERTPISIAALPIVDKSYEDSFLRPPRVQMGERPCVLGSRCICRMMARIRYGPENTMGFTCVEFLLPSERAKWLGGGGLPMQCGKCLVCLRYFVTYMHEMAESDEEVLAALESFRVQRHANPESACEKTSTVAAPAAKRARGGSRSADASNENPLASADPQWHDLHVTADELPRHANAVGVTNGYRPDVLITPGTGASDAPGMRNTRIGTLEWRKIVRFETSHYRYVKQNDEPRIVQIGVGVDDVPGTRSLNDGPPAALIGQSAAVPLKTSA